MITINCVIQYIVGNCGINMGNSKGFLVSQNHPISRNYMAITQTMLTDQTSGYKMLVNKPMDLERPQLELIGQQTNGADTSTNQ